MDNTPSRDTAKDISLGAVGGGLWRGGFSNGTTLWFVDETAVGGRIFAYKASDRTRDSGKDITTTIEDLEGGVTDGTTYWLVNDGSTALAYVLGTNARDSGKDINLGSRGVWRGAVTDGTTLWFIPLSGNLQAYKISDRTRDSAKDITLGTGSWHGGVYKDGTLWFLDKLTNYMRAYKASDQTREINNDIALGSGGWEGAVSDGTTLWFIDDASNQAVAYLRAGKRAIAYDFASVKTQKTLTEAQTKTWIRRPRSAFTTVGPLWASTNNLLQQNLAQDTSNFAEISPSTNPDWTNLQWRIATSWCSF